MNKTKNAAIRKRPQGGRIAKGVMLAPALFLLALCSIYPFIWIFKYIFYDYNGFRAYFIGFDNIIRAFKDEIYWSSVVHTFEYAFLKLLFVLPLSLITAVLFQKKRLLGGLFQGVFFLPTVISSAVYSLIWYFIFATYNGVLNGYLKFANIIESPIDWLGDAKTAMISVVIVAIWGAFGNYMILLLSGLTSIDKSVYESAEIDGASGVTMFFKITLPMLGPVLKVVVMLAITTAFKDYQSILVLTNGGPNNRTHVMFSYIYQMVFGSSSSAAQLQIGYGAVLSVISAIIIGIVTLIYLKFSKKMDEIYE